MKSPALITNILSPQAINQGSTTSAASGQIPNILSSFPSLAPGFIQNMAGEVNTKSQVENTYSDDLKKQAQLYDQKLKSRNKYLKTDNELQKEVEELTKETCEVLNIDPSEIKVNVFFKPEVDLAQGFINPPTGNIYLSKTLLEALRYDKAKLRAVIAHELGHYISRNATNPSGDKQNLGYDPIRHRVVSFQQEYFCDRVAVLVSSLFNEDLNSIASALMDIEANETKFLKDNRDESLALSVANSHPYSSRRINAVAKLAREILSYTQVENSTLKHKASGDEFEYLIKPAKFQFTLNVEQQIFRMDFSYEYFTACKLAFDKPDLLEAMFKFLLVRETINIDLVARKLGRDMKSLNKATNFCERVSKLSKDDIEELTKNLAELGELDIDTQSDLEKFPNIAVSDINQASEGVLDEDLVEMANEWFVHMFYYCKGRGLVEVFETIKTEINDLSLASLKNIFKSVNFLDFINQVDDDFDLLSSKDDEIISHYLFERYLKLSKEKGLDNKAIINEVFDLIDENALRYGSSFMQANPSFNTFLDRSFEKASDEGKKDLINIFNQRATLAFFVLNCGKLNGVESLYDRVRNYARDNDLEFSDYGYSDLLTEAINSRSDYHSFSRDDLKLVCNLHYDKNTEARIDTSFQDGNHIFDIYYNKFDLQQVKSLKEHIEKLPIGENIGLTMASPIRLACMDFEKIVKDKVEFEDSEYTNAEEFMKEELPILLEKDTNLLTKLSRIKLNNLSDLPVLDAEKADHQYSLIHGSEGLFYEYYGAGREKFVDKSYSSLEDDILVIKQIDQLWQETFLSTYSQQAPGQEKLSFLIETMPLACLARDQRICHSLAWDNLDHLSDLPKIQKAINSEKDIDLLFQLRENFFNPLLVKTCEKRLYELFTKTNVEKTQVLENEIARVQSDLQSLAPELVDDPGLNMILLAFNSRSSTRDDLLKDFIDGAENIQSTLQLASLLTEPAITALRDKDEKGQTIVEESFLDSLSRLKVEDKADTLLYFMGSRSFSSELAEEQAILLPDDREFLADAAAEAGIFSQETLDGMNRALNPVAKDGASQSISSFIKHNDIFYAMPDLLVRLSKAFAISPKLMTDLHDSVSNKKDQEEILEQLLFGINGICVDSQVKTDFLAKIAKQFVVNFNKSQSLTEEKQSAMENFIAFALNHCPQQRLAQVMLSIWNISNKENQSMPDLITNLFVNLGPAFIKFGQKLATTNIPEDYKKAFRTLSDGNKVANTTTFYHNMEVAYQRQSPFDNNASGQKIAEGSMAATYKAKLAAKNEAELRSQDENFRAVKLIHPSIKDDIETDIEFVDSLVAYMIDHKKDFDNIFLPSNTAQIIKKQLLEQVDTELEAQKVKDLEAVLSTEAEDCFFSSPKIDEENSRPGVLVSEYQPGLGLFDESLSEQGLDSSALRNSIAIEVLKQISQASSYQADVNKGNFGVLVDANQKVLKKDGKAQVLFYDGGGVEKIKKEDQKLFLQIIKAIATNSKKLPELLTSLVKESDNLDKKKLTSELTTWLSAQKRNFKSDKAGYMKMKEIFEAFIDKVSDMQLQLDDRWIVLANCISMLGPFLEGVDENRVTNLMKDSMLKAGVINKLEAFAWRLGA